MHTYLLDHIHATIDFLISISWDKSTKQRTAYESALCNAVTAAVSQEGIIAYLCDGPYHDSVKVRENMARADTIGMLAAAAAIDCEPALRFLVNKVYNVSTCNELYRAPFQATAVNNSVKAASFISDYI